MRINSGKILGLLIAAVLCQIGAEARQTKTAVPASQSNEWKLTDHSGELQLKNGDEIGVLWTPTINAGDEILHYFDDLHDSTLPANPVTTFRTITYVYQGVLSGSIVVRKRVRYSYKDEQRASYEVTDLLYLPRTMAGTFELRDSAFKGISFSLKIDDVGGAVVRALTRE